MIRIRSTILKVDGREGSRRNEDEQTSHYILGQITGVE